MRTLASQKTLAALAERVEKVINHRVNEGFTNDVEENTITHNILMNLRRTLKFAQVTDLSDILTINCEAYKYKLPLETDYGDICVIIKIDYADGSTLEGVGFLEAKIRYRASGAFSAFKLRQIQRIYKNAPHSFVLLYDYESALSGCSNIDIPYRQICEMCYPHRPKDTHAVVVPSNIVLNKKVLNRDVYKLALPFSYQLCYRYLLGLDLNFAKKPFKSAVDFAASRPQQFVMTINVVHGNRPVDNIPLIPVNEDIYSRLEGEETIIEGEE